MQFAPVRDEPTIILGIDPGTTIMGYGVIRAWSRNRVELLEMGALHLSKVKDHAAKLKRIHERCAGLIEAHTPDHFAVEAPFFGKNVQSMLKLGRAQGVAQDVEFHAALVREVPVAEYAPRRVKQAITGSGAASKEQVAGMVQRTLKIPDADMPRDLDAHRRLGYVALCHLYEMGTPTLGGKLAADGPPSSIETRAARVDQLAETSGVRSVWVGKAKSRPAALNRLRISR